MKKAGAILFLFFSLSRLYPQVTLINTGTTNNLTSLSVTDSNIVVAGRDNYLVKSHDDCNTLIPLPVPEPIGFLNYFHRVDTSVAYMLSTNFGIYSSKIYKSTDGGYNWVNTFDTTGMNLTHFRFFDANEGFAIGSLYRSLRTKNGGVTWSVGSINNIVSTAMEVFGDSMICIGGGDGSIELSKDRGHTWPFGGGYLSYNAHYRDFFFLNKDTIFGISSIYGDKAYFTRSYNGGSTWQTTRISIDGYAIYFKKANEGYAVGMNANSDGIILKTTDLGQTWLEFNTHIRTQFLDIKFLNDSVALVSGTGGILIKWNYKRSVFTGVNENYFDNVGLKVFPNPVTDKLMIQLNNNTNPVNVTVSNVVGQTVNETVFTENTSEIDFSTLQSGVYFIKLESTKGRKTLKIIKE